MWANAPLVDSVVGPTNLYTTVEDLAKWDENFYTGQVGGKAVVERVHQRGRLSDGSELNYAFGLEVGPSHQHRGWHVVEHGGSQGGYRAWMVRIPERHLSVAVLFNLFLWGMRDYALRVADLFLGDHPRWQPAPESPGVEHQGEPAIELRTDQLEDKAGTYYDARRGALREVVHAGTSLRYQGLALVPASESRFHFRDMPDAEVEFTPATERAPACMNIITASANYHYERVEKVSPTQDELAQYAGRYYSSELDIAWSLVAEDDHLVAKRRKYADSKLTPLFADAFSDDWLPLMGYPTTYLVVFERDAGGRLAGLRVTGTRVRNLWFVRQP